VKGAKTLARDLSLRSGGVRIVFVGSLREWSETIPSFFACGSFSGSGDGGAQVSLIKGDADFAPVIPRFKNRSKQSVRRWKK
jgi:hypothetical protein